MPGEVALLAEERPSSFNAVVDPVGDPSIWASPVAVAAVMLEALARALGAWDLLCGRNPYVWDIVESARDPAAAAATEGEVR